ncbi:MAG: hypothetical protein EHM93_16650 [Bacteroidales bacterium]|nr:MAG: hypothetical protein EHM93_16650 [Bacteroidales bacterium]
MILETRNLKITNKIFKPDDIRKIFQDIEKEILSLNEVNNTKQHSKDNLDESSNSRYNSSYIHLKVNAIDGSEYESESFEILEKDGILDTKQIYSIYFTFVDRKNDIQIQITLRHTNNDYDNEVSIKGRNSIWVNGLMKKVEENINILENQSTFAKKYGFLICIIILLCFTYIVTSLPNLIILLLPKQLISTETITIQMPRMIFYTIYYSFISLSFIFPSIYLTEKIKGLWLSVELQTGKEYYQIEKQRRIKLWTIISLIVIPTILSIII